jgi:hypothetical protein
MLTGQSPPTQIKVASSPRPRFSTSPVTRLWMAATDIAAVWNVD